MNTTSAIDPKKMEAFAGKLITDFGAAATGALAILGDRLGLYRALASAGPMTPSDLARQTNTNERLVREWLAAQAAAGYVEYDQQTQRFSMTPEQATALADDQSPFHMIGGFFVLSSMYHDEPKVADAFRGNGGLPWGAHHNCLFCGTERFFKPGYKANLLTSWLPALEGVVPRLKKGAKVADVGCGHGITTVLMAQVFPASQFVGFDYHAPSIDRARELAREAKVSNVQFQVADATTYPGNNYDLVAHFDSLHDMGDPAGVARHVRQSLAKDGTWMVVEPLAGDSLSENLHPVGRLFYAASTMICVPASLSQPVGLGLGAQAGEKKLKEVISKGGFTKIRRAAQTPVNMILEARL